ncbi:ATP-dependent helicase [Putridiphycobacter roseus]|uniref:ATP-dependent helicase n=1 Tax=Putridiphycobacter roseus TaxID=2219161 RepID=A0A2W1MXE6_9FLAO|nr:DEAD/DEAH box helicase [Putridiphycobacter roseus]PZE16044.1 ATP-dependent helicase [Putridiphycobacter roseus]
MNTQSILKNLNIETLNAMQLAAVEASKTSQNMLLLSPTGSGKTLAFLLSSLPGIKADEGIQLLILVPTRELVLQIESVMRAMKLNLKISTAYGGHAFKVEQNNLIDPPAILIGTPGRVDDHLKRRTFDPATITKIVFDEFDKSLEFGFTNEMEYILRKLKNLSHKFLVSATAAIQIPSFVALPNLKTIDFQSVEKPNFEFKELTVLADEKLSGLVMILSRMKKGENALVFVNHRDAADRIGVFLNEFNVAYALFHGGLKQEQREFELIKFRNGSANVLVATDIAGRGIDIPDLSTVIHYQLPTTKEVFTHRNGRTARMKGEGTVVMIRTGDENILDYTDENVKSLQLSEIKAIYPPEWTTFYIGKGKKDKINKMDIVGFMMQFDFMKKEDLGLIEVKDYFAYAAVKSQHAKKLAAQCVKAKIKNKTVKVEIVKKRY